MYALKRYRYFHDVAGIVDGPLRIPNGIPTRIFVAPRPHQIPLYPERVSDELVCALIILVCIESDKHKIIAEDVVPVGDVRANGGRRNVGANKTKIDEPRIVQHLDKRPLCRGSILAGLDLERTLYRWRRIPIGI